MTSPTALASAKPQFWGIQNIKISERHVVKEWLLAQTKELDISEGQGFSLAADSQRTLCNAYKLRDPETEQPQLAREQGLHRLHAI